MQQNSTSSYANKHILWNNYADTTSLHCLHIYILLKQINLLIPDPTGPILGAPIPPAKTPIIAPPKQKKNNIVTYTETAG